MNEERADRNDEEGGNRAKRVYECAKDLVGWQDGIPRPTEEHTPQDQDTIDWLVLAALMTSAVVGVVMALMAFVSATIAFQPDSQHMWQAAAWAAFMGGVLGMLLGLAGTALKRFSWSILGGAVVPLLVVAVAAPANGSIASQFSESKCMFHAAWLTAVACSGALCSAAAAVVRRAPRWTQVRFSLRETIVVTVIWCVFFACLRVLWNGS